MRLLLILAWLWPAILLAGHGEELEPLVKDLLMAWDRITYEQPVDDRPRAYAALTERIVRLNEQHSDVPELLTMEGVTLSAWAEIAPRLEALKLIKRARALLERAVELDPDVMDGSAYGTLGAMYAKAPGWPISFGDDDEAERYFEEALRRNPLSIDVSFYYAEYLAEQGEDDQALLVLQRALAAPRRDWRPVGEAGRRAQIRALIAQLQDDS